MAVSPEAVSPQTEHKTFRLTGTRAELESFLRIIQYIPEITAHESAIQVPPPELDDDDQALGIVDIISIFVDFSVAIGAHATWDLLKARFEDFRETRRHLVLEEVPREIAGEPSVSLEAANGNNGDSGERDDGPGQ